MLTTLGEKVRAAFKREPIAFCLTTFLLLAGAGTGMTARHILTAAPAASGAVDLASTTGVEGTSAALMRADAVLGVKGVLPKANGGTGTTVGAVSLQASTPGSADTGNFNISGRGVANNYTASKYNNPTFDGWIGSWDATNTQWAAFVPTQGTGPAAPMFAWNTGAPSSLSNANTSVYQFSVNGTQGIGISKDGRAFLGNGPPLGGIAGVGNAGVFVEVPGGGADPSLVVDTAGVAAAPTTKKLFIVRNNGIEKFSVQADGVINTTTGGFMSKVGSGTLTLAALSVAGSACQYDATTLTVASAVTTDYCSAVYTTGLSTAALSMSCEVTAANTVSFRFCNHTTTAVGIPTAQSYVAYVMR